MLDIGNPSPSETFVFSAALGAVVSIAGQIAMAHGARGLGITGSPEKCRWRKEVACFDETLCYRTEPLTVSVSLPMPAGHARQWLERPLTGRWWARMVTGPSTAFQAVEDTPMGRTIAPKTPAFGRSFEHCLVLETLAAMHYESVTERILFWRSSTG